MFDKALPYVWWGRGLTETAAKAFLELADKAKHGEGEHFLRLGEYYVKVFVLLGQYLASK